MANDWLKPRDLSEHLWYYVNQGRSITLCAEAGAGQTATILLTHDTLRRILRDMSARRRFVLRKRRSAPKKRSSR